MGRPIIDLTGLRFNRWLVVKIGNKLGSQYKWVCQCDCGNVKEVLSNSLKTGDSKSCGCHRDEILVSRAKHGLSDTRPMNTYVCMMARCYNPTGSSYKDYGGRGIGVCDRWRESFFNFWADMEEGYSDELTLERVDPNQDYGPCNCKWILFKDQCYNKTMRKDNTTGVTGVSFTDDSSGPRYCAHWVDENGKDRKRSFSVNRYGKAEALEKAISTREEAIEGLRQHGINYSEHHGKEKRL